MYLVKVIKRQFRVIECEEIATQNRKSVASTTRPRLADFLKKLLISIAYLDNDDVIICKRFLSRGLFLIRSLLATK